MPWPWLLASSAALICALATAILLYLISRAPTLEEREQSLTWGQHARPARLGVRPRYLRSQDDEVTKFCKSAREKAIADLRKIGRTSNEVPRTVEAAAQQLIASLSETERELLRDPSGHLLRLRIRLKIRQNWGLSNPNSAICFDAVDHYEAYDPDTISGVIVDAAQELLSIDNARTSV